MAEVAVAESLLYAIIIILRYVLMHLPKLPAESVLDQYSVFFEEKMPNKKAMSHKLYMHVCNTTTWD